jgi:hypothetical protein
MKNYFFDHLVFQIIANEISMWVVHNPFLIILYLFLIILETRQK